MRSTLLWFFWKLLFFMDVLKSDVKKAALVDETLRQPLVPSEKHNAFSRRDSASRHKTGLAAATKTRRCTSPSLGRMSATEGTPRPKRAQSADRGRRSSTPSTPSSRVSTPSTATSRSVTPVRDIVTELRKSSKCISSTRDPDGLWPAMRNLSSSFQSESIAAPTDKKDKTLDRTKGKVSVLTERKRSPFRRKNIGEQCENTQPYEEHPKRVIEQHRWPAMIGRQVPTNLMSRNIDLSDKATRSVPLSNTSRGLSPRKIPASEGTVKRLDQSLDEVARRLAIQASRRDGEVDSGNNIHSQTTERSKSVSRPSRTVTFPVPVVHRPPSPRKVLPAASSPSRTFQSPSRTRPSTPCRSQSTGTIQSGVTSPVTNYMVDVKKGKKNASQIENIHQLRLLYNRYLQWLFINARAADILSFQNITVESTIYNVWRNILNLRDAANVRRIMVQHLQKELRLYGILKEQIVYLEQWPALERDNSIALFGATEALKASTLRLQVTSGAKADVIALRNAVSSAVDVMQGLGSSVCCMLSKGLNWTFKRFMTSTILSTEVEDLKRDFP
ncbi:AUGMIN subunit 8-like isoform X2 [Phragmites australis]|uniref:AUGMIN subunit 8-like isoform X2 n=1 Tax=Phragmites australis TaxID=29695 RepID=UPI002D7A2667|nr:AUGMIN subunit 8-like isoform X2 [Phragmites australis]